MAKKKKVATDAPLVSPALAAALALPRETREERIARRDAIRAIKRPDVFAQPAE